MERTYKGKTYNQLGSDLQEMVNDRILQPDPLPESTPAENNMELTYGGRTYDQLGRLSQNLVDIGNLQPDALPESKPAEYKMITATEAKALYDASGAEVQAYLKYTIDPKVTAAATAGKRTTFIDLGAKPVGERPRATPLDKAVIAELEKLGYVAQFISDGDAYVPRGLADDDGNGPSYRNYGISIGW